MFTSAAISGILKCSYKYSTCVSANSKSLIVLPLLPMFLRSHPSVLKICTIYSNIILLSTSLEIWSLMEDLTASKNLFFFFAKVNQKMLRNGSNFHHQFDYILIVNVSHDEVLQMVSFPIILDVCWF